jgi:hypothetical protein
VNADTSEIAEAREAREALAVFRLGMELGARLAGLRARLAELAADPPEPRPRHLKVVP